MSVREHLSLRLIISKLARADLTSLWAVDPRCDGTTSASLAAYPDSLQYSLKSLEEISEADFEAMFTAMGDVMAESLSVESSATWVRPFWQQRKSTFRCNRYAYLVQDTTGQLVAFATFEKKRVREGRVCIYMGSGYVLPAYQGCGIGHRLTSRMLWRGLLASRGRTMYMASDIMNPVVLAGWRQRVRDSQSVFPALGGNGCRKSVESVSRELLQAHDLDGSVDFHTGVIHGRSNPRDSVIPRAGDAPVDDYFHRLVDPTRGDTLMMVVELRLRTLLLSIGALGASLRLAINRRVRMKGGHRR